MATLARLHIEIQDLQPAPWRRVEVPEDLSLAALHVVLQEVMGWSQAHLYEFRVGGRVFGAAYDPWHAAGEDVRDVTIARVLGPSAPEITYRYGPSLAWRHTITWEGREPNGAGLRCLDGQRACPLEASGGPVAYQALLRWRASGSMDASLASWATPSHDPAAFSVREVVFSDLATLYTHGRSSAGLGSVGGWERWMSAPSKPPVPESKPTPVASPPPEITFEALSRHASALLRLAQQESLDEFVSYLAGEVMEGTHHMVVRRRVAEGLERSRVRGETEHASPAPDDARSIPSMEHTPAAVMTQEVRVPVMTRPSPSAPDTHASAAPTPETTAPLPVQEPVLEGMEAPLFEVEPRSVPEVPAFTSSDEPMLEPLPDAEVESLPELSLGGWEPAPEFSTPASLPSLEPLPQEAFESSDFPASSADVGSTPMPALEAFEAAPLTYDSSLSEALKSLPRVPTTRACLGRVPVEELDQIAQALGLLELSGRRRGREDAIAQTLGDMVELAEVVAVLLGGAERALLRWMSGRGVIGAKEMAAAGRWDGAQASWFAFDADSSLGALRRVGLVYVGEHDAEMAAVVPSDLEPGLKVALRES